MSEFDPPADYFDRDDYGVIINGEGTYAELGKILFFDDPTPSSAGLIRKAHASIS